MTITHGGFLGWPASLSLVVGGCLLMGGMWVGEKKGALRSSLSDAFGAAGKLGGFG